MARVVDAEIERLRAEVAVERLAEARGVVLRREGARLVGRCPFHGDEAESLVVDPVENGWRCRGVCGAGGSVVEWVMRAEGVSQRHAVELLRAGVTPTGVGVPPRQGSVCAAWPGRWRSGWVMLSCWRGWWASTPTR